MSPLSAARNRLQKEYERALGHPETVLIGGTSYPAIYDDVTSDDLVMAGANGEAGGFRVSVPADKFAEKPPRGESIAGRGMELQILSVIDRNGVEYEIVAGDLASLEDA